MQPRSRVTEEDVEAKFHHRKWDDLRYAVPSRRTISM